MEGQQFKEVDHAKRTDSSIEAAAVDGVVNCFQRGCTAADRHEVLGLVVEGTADSSFVITSRIASDGAVAVNFDHACECPLGETVPREGRRTSDTPTMAPRTLFRPPGRPLSSANSGARGKRRGRTSAMIPNTPETHVRASPAHIRPRYGRPPTGCGATLATAGSAPALPRARSIAAGSSFRQTKKPLTIARPLTNTAGRGQGPGDATDLRRDGQHP